MLSGPSFRLAFVPCINSLILSSYPLISFHLTEASLSAFSWLYTLVCVVVPKYPKTSFIYNYSHFWYSFCNQSVLFAQLENANYGTATERICERTKSKQKQNRVTSQSNWPRVLLFYLAHIQWNGIIKGRLHWLTSESQGRFLVNNILFDSA